MKMPEFDAGMGSAGVRLVPKAGLEPARPQRRGILNPLRLPFRHLGLATLSKRRS